MKKQRTVTFAAATVLALAHASYIFLALMQSALHAVVASGLLVFVAAEYRLHFSQLHIPAAYAEAGVTLLSCIAGASAAYLLSHIGQLGPIGAGAAVGTVAGLLPARRFSALENVRTALYCGAFAGMSARTVLTNIYTAAAAGLICGLIIVASAGALRGYGGKLGTIAFSSVCLTAALTYILTV